MYIHIHYTYINIHIHIYTHIYIIHIYTYTYTYIYIHTYIIKLSQHYRVCIENGPSVEGFCMQKLSNPCKHGQRTSNGDYDDDDNVTLTPGGQIGWLVLHIIITLFRNDVTCIGHSVR